MKLIKIELRCEIDSVISDTWIIEPDDFEAEYIDIQKKCEKINEQIGEYSGYNSSNQLHVEWIYKHKQDEKIEMMKNIWHYLETNGELPDIESIEMASEYADVIETYKEITHD